MKIKYIGWAQFVLKNGKTVCIDPFYECEKADVVLATHGHPDHLDVDALKKISKDNTTVITNNEAAQMVENAEIIAANETKTVDGIKVTAVEAYNHKIPNHQKGKDLGFVIEIDGKKIYHCGDTDFIEEMKNIKDIDVMLVPVGGTYVMDVSQAIKAIKLVKPKIAIPMHYGKISVEFQGQKMDIDLPADIAKLKQAVESQTSTKVVELNKGEEYSC